MFRQNMAWYDSQQSGQLQSRLIEDLEKVRLGVSDKVALSVQNLSTFVTGIVLGSYKSITRYYGKLNKHSGWNSIPVSPILAFRHTMSSSKS